MGKAYKMGGGQVDGGQKQIALKEVTSTRNGVRVSAAPAETPAVAVKPEETEKVGVFDLVSPLH